MLRIISSLIGVKRKQPDDTPIVAPTAENSGLTTPSILNVSSFASLIDQFSDLAKTLILPFPTNYSFSIPNRFSTTRNSASIAVFNYDVRESFRILLKEVQALVDQDLDETIRYIGNMGAGKSHNLAALVVFLRKCKLHNLGITKDVVYIPSCEYLSMHKVDVMTAALIDAFPTDKAKLSKLKEWSELIAFVQSRPQRSILFIFDDWQFALSEANVPESENNRRYLLHQDLIHLTLYQYRIEAISAFTPLLTSVSSRDQNPHHTKFVYLYGGLTDREWAARKARSAFISCLSEEEEAQLRDYTGGVPLYLTAIGCYEGDLSERMAMFHKYEGINIVDNLEHSSRDYAAVDERKFTRQMRYAVNGEGEYLDESLYDHRYFYRDSDYMLRPVSGFVREAMREILRDFATKAYYRQLDKPWIDKAMAIGNDAVKEFAFKTYAVYAVTRDPSRYFEGVPNDIAECTVKYYDGDYPAFY